MPAEARSSLLKYPEYLGWTLGRVLEEQARRLGDKAFFRFEGERIGWREMNDRANRLANGLKGIGVAKGEGVASLLPNRPEGVDLWFASAKAGSVWIPVNTGLRGEGLRYILDHSDAKTLILDASLRERWEEVRSGAPKIERVVVVGAPPARGEIPWKEAAEGPSATPSVEVKPSDVESILYTSGTTGPPKGVVKRHDVIGRRMASGLAKERYTSEDVLHTCLPLFHINAQVLTFHAALASDASVALGRRFSAGRFWEEVRGHGATWTSFIGAMVSILWKQPPSEGDRNHSVRFANSVGAPRDLHEPFHERFGVRLTEVYAMTEGGYLRPDPAAPPGSMGRPAEGMEARIVDSEDREVPPGTQGEIVFRPRIPGVRLVEYYKAPAATEEKTRGGWLRTGDLGWRDEKGFFFFVDRSKECIRRRGENVSPWELEQALNAHPKVLESAAFGVPSELGEEDVMVAVVPKPGAAPDPPELIEWLRKRVSDFALPRYVELVESLPKTATERVERYRLKARGVGPATWVRP